MSSLDGNESESPVVVDNESQQLREDYETMSESEDETEHDALSAVPATVDDDNGLEDDDLALLAFAKQRLAEQQTKDEEATRRRLVDDEEEEEEEEEAVEGDCDGERCEDDEVSSESGSVKEEPQASVSGESKSADVEER